MNKSILSDREQNEILSALQSLNALNGSMADPVLSKMGMLFKKDNANWIDVDFSHWGSDEKEREKFTLVKNSILERTLLSFDYFSSYGEKSSRMIELLKLFTIKTSIPFSDWIYGYIMSFGEQVEVLEPAELKNEIRNKCEKVLRKYL
nr:WYL domain-containing protein [uncultured Acetobacterium sp.]